MDSTLKFRMYDSSETNNRRTADSNRRTSTIRSKSTHSTKQPSTWSISSTSPMGRSRPSSRRRRREESDLFGGAFQPRGEATRDPIEQDLFMENRDESESATIPEAASSPDNSNLNSVQCVGGRIVRPQPPQDDSRSHPPGFPSRSGPLIFVSTFFFRIGVCFSVRPSKRANC